MRVGLREANQHFSRIMKAVRNGAEVILTDRGRPVARLTPIGKPGADADAVERALAQLVREGVLSRAPKRGRLPYFKPRKIRGEPISETLARERAED